MKLTTPSPVMLAYNGTWTPDDLRKNTHYYRSNKVDGVRAWDRLGSDGRYFLATRTPNKFIENKHTQAKFNDARLANLDGELIIPGCDFHETSGILRSYNDPRGSNAVWCIFDVIIPDLSYDERRQYMAIRACAWPAGVYLLQQHRIDAQSEECIDEWLAFERGVLRTPFEGYIIRSGSAKYKFGRATRKEASLFKVVNFNFSYATVLGFVQRREVHSDKLLPLVGAIRCAWKDTEFLLGTGWSTHQAEVWWEQRDELVNRTIEFKYKLAGMQELPRQAVYISGLPI